MNARISYSILVADDEAAQRQLLRAVLEKEFSVVTVANGQEARQLLRQRNFDLVIADERMPVMSGSELIRWMKENVPETPVIVLTAYGSIQTAVEAIKLGAHDYLTKPLKSPDELRLLVTRTLNQKILQNERLVQRADAEASFPSQGIVAVSEGMKAVLELAFRVARQTTTVFLTGESGTGKEVLARYIHRSSPRAEAPFVALNCAAVTETLLESELFGHEKGAFTGATQAKQGRFELAHGGTLFLDEIAEMSVDLQVKLLRVLQERQFERVGGTRTIIVDVRVIAATNRELESEVEKGGFRRDLYYRLSVFPIHIPPLRERREDILPLAEHFLGKLVAKMRTGPKRFGQGAKAMLWKYDWPGNVRELQNAIERALIISQSASIEPEDLPLGIPRSQGPAEPSATLADIEKAAILHALAANEGDRRRTAEQLQISLRTLQYRLKEYGISARKGGTHP